jgi:hypothetical protein
LTVTLNLANGFSFIRPVWYLSADATIPLEAAIGHNTYAQLMGNFVLGHCEAGAQSSQAPKMSPVQLSAQRESSMMAPCASTMRWNGTVSTTLPEHGDNEEGRTQLT